MKSTMRVIAILAFAFWGLSFLFTASPGFAQSQAGSGQIVGVILDTSGKAIPDASMKATNRQTGLVQRTTSGANGLYRVVLLPTGSYDVSAEKPGFAKVTLEEVQVVVGQTTDANITLAVGAVKQTITVTAAAIGVQSTQTNQDAVINQRAISDLPINGRRFQDFVTLTPGAQVDPQRGQISLSGQRGINTNTSIDGADYNQPFFGGIRGGERSNDVYTIPQEAIKEFQVVGAGYTAEFGRSTGGVVNAVTKSGTNDFHGSLFYLDRHSGVSRKNEFFDAVEEARGLPVTAAPTQLQWGGSFGGPVKKDKAFFLIAYEQQHLNQERQILFDRLAGLTPNPNTQEAFGFYKSLEAPFSQTNNGKSYFARFDHVFSENHRLNVRYNGSTSSAINANATGNSVFPSTDRALSNNGNELDRTNTVTGQLTSILTSQLVNEFRGQWSRETRPRLANAASPTVENTIGRFGTVSFLPTTEFDYRAQFADAVTWTRGSHTFKFGVEYNHIFADQTFAFNQFGRFTFSITDVAKILDILSAGGAVANRFDDRSVRYFRQVGNGRLSFSLNLAGLFFQDAWRIRPNFTVNYGVRWDGQFNPAPETSNTALVNTVKGFRFPSGDVADPTQIPDSTDGVGPRVGFAWDPFKDSKTVIRGYGGIYYGPTPSLLFTSALNNFRTPAGDLSIQLPLVSTDTVFKELKLIGVDLNKFTLDNLPILTADQVASVGQALGLSLNPNAGVQPFVVDPEFKNPRSYQSGIGVERQVARGLTLGADFTYIHTLRLERDRDLNLPLPVAKAGDPAERPNFGLRSGGKRPIPTLGSVTSRQSSAKSLYRAFTARAQLRRSWGQLSAFYTLSWTKADDDNERDATGFRAENAFNLKPEYNDSNIDQRHQFVANPVIFLPYGFTLSSAIRISSGHPVDAIFGSDANEDLAFNDRPFRAPGVPFQRNEFRDFARYNVDFRVEKSFSLGETRRLSLWTEFFNLFNLKNLTLSGSTVTNFCGGKVPLDCGFGPPTNPDFLQLREQNPASPRLGKLLLNNNPGSPYQTQFGIRFEF